MASFQQFPSGNFHITFHFGGKRFKRSLKTKDKRQTQAIQARLEETIRLVQLGRIKMPLLVDVPAFLLADGNSISQPEISNDARLGEKAPTVEILERKQRKRKLVHRGLVWVPNPRFFRAIAAEEGFP